MWKIRCRRGDTLQEREGGFLEPICEQDFCRIKCASQSVYTPKRMMYRMGVKGKRMG